MPAPQLFLYDSNDKNESEREEIKVPKTNNISKDQKDSQQEMNNFSENGLNRKTTERCIKIKIRRLK